MHKHRTERQGARSRPESYNPIALSMIQPEWIWLDQLMEEDENENALLSLAPAPLTAAESPSSSSIRIHFRARK
jgi:hypothetical protein